MLMRTLGNTAADAADRVVYLAASPEVASVTGQYFAKRKPGKLSRAAQDDAAADRLWAESERLCGLSPSN